ncbi:PH domain-containing protein [Pseudonocardia sp. GCM10023141]|uniref:PH domain-containing protein n=1 Tax=Pseudonocardia sp. GCM10023141 TaxID=3252653 RepID=UPI0036103D7A
MSSTEPEPAPAEAPAPSQQVVFRISPLVILVALAFAFCMIPIGTTLPFGWLLFLVPLAMIVWTVRVRTTVDTESLTVRRIAGTRRVPWVEISSLRLGPGKQPSRSRISAVLSDGAELPLPAVHVRDIPRLAAASGGRLPYPAGE